MKPGDRLIDPGMGAKNVLACVKEQAPRVLLGIANGVGAVMELAWLALPLKGEPLMTRFLAAQVGTSHHYDLTAARRDLGNEPIVDDATAMQRTVGWLKGELAAGRL